MKRKGYRRLYHSPKCNLTDEGSSEYSESRLQGYSFSIDGFSVEVFIGMRPRFTFAVASDPLQAVRLVLAGETISGEFRYQSDLSATPYQGSFVTDIVCWTSVPEILMGDEDRFKKTSDNVAALIGLRLHSQFVKSVIDEGFLLDDGTGEYQYRSMIMRFRIGESVVLSVPQMETKLFPNGEKTQINESVIKSPALSWLLRAWNRDDPVDEFVALFIPLEIILEGYRASRSDHSVLEDKIRVLLAAHAGAATGVLTSHLEQLIARQPPPSLAHRFEAMAKSAMLESQELDIQSFRKFNRMRNALVHRGELYLQTAESLQKKDVWELEKLVTCYLNWTLLRNKL